MLPLIYILVGILVLLAICLIFGGTGNGANPGSATAPAPADLRSIQTSAVQTAWAAVTQTAQARLVKTGTPPPIAPTHPSLPTPDTNIIDPGTYMVGKDVKPGLYEGTATDTCFWARLKDASGTADSILASNNSVGQYYIRVKSTDYALRTDCQLSFIPAVPQVARQMPAKIDPGMYLVGIDIQQGTYQGQAGAGNCTWERLRDVDGTPDAIIVEGRSAGQFFFQVSIDDFALSTTCELVLVGE